jgi:transcriptional regulator with XRE-family HTH domain
VQQEKTTSVIFSDRLKELMVERETTQDAVAQACDVSQAAVSKWVKGIIPNGEQVARLAALFDVSTDYLLGRQTTITRYKETPTVRDELHDKLREIERSDPEGFTTAKTVIETLYHKTPRGRKAVGLRVKPKSEQDAESELLDAAVEETRRRKK